MRKRLNNKGFTLVELLAVVVILAIVMGISANAVLTSINNSRKNSLHGAAQNAANTVNTWAMEDAMATDASSKMLGDAFLTTYGTGAWKCLTTSMNIAGRGTTTNLLTALGLSGSDIVIKAESATTIPAATGYANVTGKTPAACSAIRYNKSIGAYEFLFIAKESGKYFVTTDNDHYAFSKATGPYMKIAD